MNKSRKGYKKVKWLFGKELEIPEEWEFFSLDKLTKITDGSHFSPTKVENGFPLATVENVKENIIDINSCYNISKNDYRKLIKNGNNPEKGDVLFTKDGTVGKTLVYQQDNKIVLLSSIAIIRKSKNFNSMFCNYALQSKFMTKHLAKYFGGTAIKRIVLKHLSKYEFPLPSLPEQQKIASILSGVDALIELTQQTIDKTERLKKGLMQDLLTRGIAHTRFKRVKWFLGKEIEIPDKWTLEKLTSICKIRKSNNVSSDLYIGLEHIGLGNNFVVSAGNVNEFTSTKNTFFQGDILYGKLRPLLNKVWLATKSGYCSTDILPLVPTSKILPQILLFVMTSHNFLGYAVRTSAGTKMPRTSWSDIKKFSVILPNMQEQQKIASILSGVDAHIQKNQQYKEALEKLKKGLMQKLLTGQIRVKV